jgi:pimeloyl-ACP methyl ester carboxylesterase
MSATPTTAEHTRRRFLGGAAAAMLAARLGMPGAARARAATTTKEPAMTTSAIQRDATPAANAAIRPFRVDVPQADLDDLRRRLAATRWPEKETVSDWSQGVPLASLQELIGYWATNYDWRKVEARLNALPQFMTAIDGLDIHFIHVRSQEPNALPLIVTHGWPGSVIEQLNIIDPLTNPTAHGGAAADAFDVVVPSIPGFGFSGRPTGPGWDSDRIARAWAELMGRLGYDRYVAQGGDVGAVVSEAMARQAPAGLLGIHTNLPATIPAEVGKALTVGGPAPANLSPQERAAFDALLAFNTKYRAYSVMMATRPQTIGYALMGSPEGLAAWIYDYNNGEPARLLPKDAVLDDISLYWLTNTATSAARWYWENGGKSPLSAAAQRTDQIKLPVAITVFPGEIYRAPESWARRAYPHLSYFHAVAKGGHFAAWEQPQLFASELRAAFRSLR